MLKTISEDFAQALRKSQTIRRSSQGVLEGDDNDNIVNHINHSEKMLSIPEIRTRYLIRRKKEAEENPLKPKNNSRYSSVSPDKGSSKNRGRSSVDLPRTTLNETDRSSPGKKMIETDVKKINTNVNFFENNADKPFQKKKVPTEDHTLQIIAMNSARILIQPRYMQYHGTMCVSEFWHEKDKIKLLHDKKDQVIDANNLPMTRINKDFISVYRPYKMEQEFREKRVLLEERLEGLANRIYRFPSYVFAPVEKRVSFDSSKNSESFRRLTVSPVKRRNDLLRTFRNKTSINLDPIAPLSLPNARKAATLPLNGIKKFDINSSRTSKSKDLSPTRDTDRMLHGRLTDRNTRRSEPLISGTHELSEIKATEALEANESLDNIDIAAELQKLKEEDNEEEDKVLDLKSQLKNDRIAMARSLLSRNPTGTGEAMTLEKR